MGNPRQYCRKSDFGSEGEFVMSNGDKDDRLCTARHDLLYVRLEAMDKALELNARNVESRLQSLNELRSEVVKDREQFLPTLMYNAKHGELERWIKSVDSAVNRLSGNDGPITALERRVVIVETKLIAFAAGIITLGTLIQIAIHFWKG